MSLDKETAVQARQLPVWVLLLTVFITGASVLVIELIGTRVLAPFFGSGIYTWSALIAVTLAAQAQWRSDMRAFLGREYYDWAFY